MQFFTYQIYYFIAILHKGSLRWFPIAYIFLLSHGSDIKTAPNLGARYLSKNDIAALSFEV